MRKLTISQYMKREDSYPVSVATIRRYIDSGVLQGEKLRVGHSFTYFVHIADEQKDKLFERILAG